MTVIEEGLSLFRSAGFDPKGTVLAHRILGAYTIGSAVIEMGEPIGGVTSKAGFDHEAFPANEFPTLNELHSSHHECGFDEGFERSIRVIIDAVEHHFRRST
jgi:hypothetical protein